jgi:predicted amidophosphoribosyltransferase
MANTRTGSCPQCGYRLPKKETLRCPRCNMSLVEKCLDCTGCSPSAWEKKDDVCPQK